MQTSLPSLLLASIRKYPEHVALRDVTGSVTYGELADRIWRCSEYIQKKGLSTGDRVAILLPNSVDYVAFYYAAQLCGCVAIGLNTESKAKDLSNWLAHSGSSLLISTSRMKELAPLKDMAGQGTRIETVEELEIGMESDPRDLSETIRKIGEYAGKIDSTLPAALIYTSGTTGKPKGVTLSHCNLYENTKSIVEYLELESSDIVMNVLPFYYSYGNSVLHTHLAVGATVFMENSMMYPHKLLKQIEDYRITGFSGVPSTFALLLNRTRLEDFNLGSLRYLTQAGGAMAPSLIDRTKMAIPQARFFVMYGQTEATARLTWLPPDQLEQKRGSVGIPIPGVSIEIRDKKHNKMPAGEVGEICATGKNIMIGYWQDPELTRSVIRDGWLYTGDLGHMDEDGYIYISGRSSDMIKSGANRISPNEIEEVLVGIDEVAEAAVVGIPDEIMGQLIKAYIVPAEGTQPDMKKIQAYCRKNLALYKIPKYIEFIDSLPKTGSGKIKRFLLGQKNES